MTVGGGSGLGERTIARNVYLRLLFARKQKNVDATKVLETIRQLHGSWYGRVILRPQSSTLDKYFHGPLPGSRLISLSRGCRAGGGTLCVPR